MQLLDAGGLDNLALMLWASASRRHPKVVRRSASLQTELVHPMHTEGGMHTNLLEAYLCSFAVPTCLVPQSNAVLLSESCIVPRPNAQQTLLLSCL